MISNNFIHLTNFSINKESGNFVNNSNPEEPEVISFVVCLCHFQLKSEISGVKVDADKFVEIFQIKGNWNWAYLDKK